MKHDCSSMPAPDEVHVWTLPLDRQDHETESLVHLLDPDELTRLERFRCQTTARRFITSHAGLRLLLSHYLRLPFSKIRYVSGCNGKPALLPPASLHFSLSHSSDLAVVAVSPHPVGIDLEQIDRNIPFESIARRFFSSAEQQALGSLPQDRRLQAFYLCWTRKEAYLKASGAGFSLPCNCFDVSVTPGEPAELLQHGLDQGEPLRWQLHDLLLPTGFQGSLAVTKNTNRISRHSGAWNAPPLSHFHP